MDSLYESSIQITQKFGGMQDFILSMGDTSKQGRLRKFAAEKIQFILATSLTKNLFISLVTTSRLIEPKFT